MRRQAALDERKRRLEAARLYLICDAQPDAFLRAALSGGVDVLQLRLKDAPEQEIVAAGRRFAAAAAEHGALFIINDRPELVGDTGADGVHVGQEDTPVGRARQLAGPQCLVGLSTHSREQIERASGPEGSGGAGGFRSPELPDYIGVGPIFTTPTKPGRPAVGLELLSYAAEHATVPFFAIGGIDERNVARVAGAGGRRVAVVRALVQATDPRSTAERLRAALRTERDPVGAA